MALALLIVLATAHLEDAHLVVQSVRHDSGFDSRTGHQGGADLVGVAVDDGEYLVDHDFLADVRSNLFYFDLFAGSNAILLATGFYDRVHIDLEEGWPEGTKTLLHGRIPAEPAIIA
jgi:octaprenyl-diphosphate synthase